MPSLGLISGAARCPSCRERFSVPIDCDDGIGQRRSDIPENVERHFRRYIEKFTILSNAKIREPVNHLVHHLLDLVELGRADGGVDREGQGNRRIVKLLGTDVDRAGTLADFDPILPEALVGQDVYVPGC